MLSSAQKNDCRPNCRVLTLYPNNWPYLKIQVVMYSLRFIVSQNFSNGLFHQDEIVGVPHWLLHTCGQLHTTTPKSMTNQYTITQFFFWKAHAVAWWGCCTFWGLWIIAIFVTLTFASPAWIPLSEVKWCKFCFRDLLCARMDYFDSKVRKFILKQQMEVWLVPWKGTKV